MNAKIERRVDFCHRNYFLAGNEAQKVGLCSDTAYGRILINAHSNGLRARAAALNIDVLVRNGLSNLR